MRLRGGRDDSPAAAEFEGFVRRHAADLSRLAYLLTGDADEADDLAGDVMLVAWQHWDRVSGATNPVAYLRRTTTNLAASRIRRKQLWRSRLPLLGADVDPSSRPPDGSAVDVRAALARLPARRRACVVLRLAFDLSEHEVADTLGISVGTVKSQTSKAVRVLRGLLDDEPVTPAAATSPRRAASDEIERTLFERPPHERPGADR
ncbi:MAG: RNA polymerase sigma factor [Kineosporiaceae bacterium]